MFLWTDESLFTREGIFNSHNMQHWSEVLALGYKGKSITTTYPGQCLDWSCREDQVFGLQILRNMH